MKIHPVGAELFHTDGHDEAFRNFAKAPKNGKGKMYACPAKVTAWCHNFAAKITCSLSEISDFHCEEWNITVLCNVLTTCSLVDKVLTE